MIKKDLVIAVIVTFCLTATLFMITPTRSQPAGQYDPWADINEDGIIDMKDIRYSAKLFGAEGDPTKNVTVTNWPTGHEVSVLWNYHLYYPINTLYSETYNASGFGHLHMNIGAAELTGEETLTLTVFACISNQAHTSLVEIQAYNEVLNASKPYDSISIPVPSERFLFLVESWDADCYVYFSFFLTWA